MLLHDLSAKLAPLIAKTSLPPNVVPHIIDAVGLSEDNLGQRRFAQELVARREWIAENCYGVVEIGPIRDAQMRLVGRRFQFADLNDAIYFMLRWGGEVR
jgi:chorismate-pyruvate lyase